MTVTFLDLLRSSFRCISTMHEAQDPSPDEITDATWVANSMLDAWGAKRPVYAIQILQLNLVPNQMIYTIGPGANFNTGANGRPERIEEANLIFTDTNPPVRRPMSVLTFEDWSRITVQNISSSVPLAMYLDEAWPLANIYLWPTPSLAYQLELYVWGQLSQIMSPTQAINLPPAYADAFRYDLAVRLAQWDGQLRAGVPMLARDSLAALESINAPKPKLRNDALHANGRHRSIPTFNYLDGTGR